MTNSFVNSAKTSGILASVAIVVATPAASWAAPTAPGNALGDAWARVGTKRIGSAEVKRALSGLTDRQQSRVLSDEASRRQVLANLIDQEVLVIEGERRKLAESQKFKDALENFRKQYLSTRVLEDYLEAEMTPAATRAYYDRHKYRYNLDVAHPQHILLQDEKTALQMLERAKSGKEDFQDLAERFSRDPSAKNNRGDMGLINRDAPYVPEFKEAVFAAAEGDILGPLKTSFGYHIVRIVEKRPGKTLSFEESELKLRNDMRQELSAAYIAKLKRGLEILVNNPRVAKGD